MSGQERGAVIRAATTILVAVIPIGMGVTNSAQAHVTSAPRTAPEFQNAVGLALGYGRITDSDATFWGVAVEYSRAVLERWVVGAGLAWDEETERRDDRQARDVRSLSVLGTVSYNLSSRFSLTAGLEKGFADTDNPSGSMQYADGDLGVGFALGFATPGLPQYVQDSIGLSLNYEYNLSEGESSVSLDLVFGWSF